MTPISEASLRGLPRSLPLVHSFGWYRSYLRSRSGGWWAAGLSTRDVRLGRRCPPVPSGSGGIQPSQTPPYPPSACTHRAMGQEEEMRPCFWTPFSGLPPEDWSRDNASFVG